MIAERAGLHHSTVSLALRDSPLIADKTKNRIAAIAQELGYVPDPVLSALNAYRQQRRSQVKESTIGWVTHQSCSSETPWSKVGLYMEYYSGAYQRAAALGYRLEEFAVKPGGYTTERLAEVLLSRGIQGLLVCPQREPGTSFDFSRFSAVKFGYSWAAPGLKMVTNHHFLTCARALSRLRELGYRKVGLALPLGYNRGVRMLLLGAYWVDYHQQPAHCQIPPMMSDSWGADCLRQWLEEYEPEVILSDHVTIGPLLEELEYPVPEKVALASIGLTADETHFAGIYQNNARIGEVAVNMLSSMIHHNEIGLLNAPENVLLEGEWRDGPSAPGVRG